MAAATQPSRARVLFAIVVLAAATVGTAIIVVVLALDQRIAVGLTALAALGFGVSVGWLLRHDMRPGGRDGGALLIVVAMALTVAVAKGPGAVQLEFAGALCGFLAVCTAVVSRRQL